MTSCANCNTEIRCGGHKVISPFQIVFDKQDQITILSAIGELFGVSDKLRQFIKNYQSGAGVVTAPQICKMCLQMLENSFKWKNQFRSLCHPDAQLRSLLFDSGSISHSSEQESTESESEIRLPKNVKLRNCSVAIKRLPHVYMGKKDSLHPGDVPVLLTSLKLEKGQSDITDESVDQTDPEYDLPIPQLQCKVEIEVEPGTTIEVSMDDNTDKPNEMSYEYEDQDEDNDWGATMDSDPLFLNPEFSESDFDFESSSDKNSSLKKQQVSSSALLAKPIYDMYTRTETNPRLFEFPCDNCTKKYAFRAELMSHSAFAHRDPSDMRSGLKCPQEGCPLSDREFKFQFELTKHLLTHTKETPFKCLKGECSFECGDEVEMRNHCVSHFRKEFTGHSSSSGRGPITCEVCGKQWTRRDRYEVHMLGHVRPEECPACGKGFVTKPIMMAHCSRVHRVRTNPPEPKVPETKYFSRIVSTQTFKCQEEDCNEEFPFNALLMSHVSFDHLRHPDSTLDNHLKCSVPSCTVNCSRRSKSQFKAHCFTHTKEKMYKCEEPGCNYSSVTIKYMKYHIFRMHSKRENGEACIPTIIPESGSNRNLLHCVQRKPKATNISCGSHQETAEGLQKHLDEVHGLGSERHQNEKSSLSPFKCQVADCYKTFRYRALMLSHMSFSHFPNNRTGDKVRCHICNTVTLANNLSRHMSTHTKELLYRSGFRGSEYATTDNYKLNAHWKTYGHSSNSNALDKST